MRKVVLSPFYPVSDKLDISHRAGWARYWANELGAELFTTKRMAELDELKKGDEVYVYHGMEFKGQLNLQSGLTDEILLRVKRMLDAARRGVVFISIDIPMPKYGDLLMERGMDPTSGEKLNRVSGRHFAGVPDTKVKHIVVGDSHALSMYTPGTIIFREDGQTLHGALKRGLLARLHEAEFEHELDLKKVERVTFYYGNIDIRHHLHRQSDARAAAKELLSAYTDALHLVRKALKPNVELELVTPLPIEHESRQIPKSGWYKGSAFFGTWQERTEVRKLMVADLKRLAKKVGATVYEHPKHFTNKQGELSFDVMEQPRSVHIRPAEYRLIQEGHTWLV
jgi:hypothetical protein